MADNLCVHGSIEDRVFPPPLPSIPNPGINVSVENVNHNAHHRHNRREKYHQSLYDWIIPLGDGFKQTIG